MKKPLSLLLALAMCLALFAGCGSGAPDDAASPSPSVSPQEEAPAANTVTIAQSYNFSAGFATEVHSYECTYYMVNWYDTLVEQKDGKYVPSLATDWKVSDDGLTYTFNLRDDVKFSDGTAFNAESVKLYYDNMRPALGASANYGQLDMYTTDITVDSEFTVSIHLSQRYFGVLKDLSMTLPRGIMSAAAFNEDGSVNSDYLLNNTAGTGPYMFESVNATATEYVFVSNPYYWGEKPEVDSFKVKIIPDSKVAAMQAGEVDFIMGSDTLDASSYIEISSWNGYAGALSGVPCATEFISLNSEAAPLDDLKLRTAIQMGIDKDAIAANLYNGLKTPASSVMSTELPYCGSVSVTTPGYDFAAANALLDEAGYLDTNGDGYREADGAKLSFKITYPSTGAYDNTILAFQSYMLKLGIEIVTDPVDLMTFMQNIFMGMGTYDMTCYISYWVPYDPYTFVANMYPSLDYTDPSGIYSTDPQVAKALATMDVDEAKALIAGLYATDDDALVEEIYATAINSANESSVVIPIDYTNEYAVYNEAVIASYTFNEIPNRVDVAAITVTK